MPRQKLTQRTDGYFKVKYHDKQFYGKTIAACHCRSSTPT